MDGPQYNSIIASVLGPPLGERTMYAFFVVILCIIAAIGLALLIGIGMALSEGAGTPRR